MSLWECDRLCPVWAYWPRIGEYLGFDPFSDPALGRCKGNESKSVAFLSTGVPPTLGQRIIAMRYEMRKTRKQLAAELGVNPKTLWAWEKDRWRPSSKIMKRIKCLSDLKAAG